MDSTPVRHSPTSKFPSEGDFISGLNSSEELYCGIKAQSTSPTYKVRHVGLEFRPGAASHGLGQQDLNFVSPPPTPIYSPVIPVVISTTQNLKESIGFSGRQSRLQILDSLIPDSVPVRLGSSSLPLARNSLNFDTIHASTSKWERNEYKFRRVWERLEKLLRERFDKSTGPQGRYLNGERKAHYRSDALFPRDLAQWNEYSHLTMTWNAAQEKKKIAQLEQRARQSDSSIIPLLGGKVLHDRNLGTVLAQPTAFCKNYSNKERDAFKIWPTLEQYRLEGDDRVKTSDESPQYGRFLPLPRHPSNNSVAWTQRKFIMPLKFDDAFEYKLGRTEAHHENDGCVTRPGLPPINFENDFANELCDIHQFLNQDLLDELGTLN